MAPRQIDMGNASKSHYGGFREIHQQTRNCDTAEQKMEKSEQMGTMRMRACSGPPSQKTYKTILTTIEKDKSMKIIGGDFNAEFGPGEGIELSAVGHYTLNKAHCRGEWMTQWLLENKLTRCKRKITAEASDVPHSKEWREAAGLHSDRHETLLLEQRRRGERHEK